MLLANLVTVLGSIQYVIHSVVSLVPREIAAPLQPENRAFIQALGHIGDDIPD